MEQLVIPHQEPVERCRAARGFLAMQKAPIEREYDAVEVEVEAARGSPSAYASLHTYVKSGERSRNTRSVVRYKRSTRRAF